MALVAKRPGKKLLHLSCEEMVERNERIQDIVGGESCILQRIQNCVSFALERCVPDAF